MSLLSFLGRLHRRDRRLENFRASQDQLQAEYDARADAEESELTALLEIPEPDENEQERITFLTADIPALRAAAERIRNNLAAGLP